MKRRSSGDQSWSPAGGSWRERTSRACDRCRVKKLKCSGSSPCERCAGNDIICRFTANSNLSQKLISAAQAYELQIQQKILVNAIRVMWRRHVEQVEGDHQKSREEPSIHDIVSELGVLEGIPNLLEPEGEEALRKLKEESLQPESHVKEGSEIDEGGELFNVPLIDRVIDPWPCDFDFNRACRGPEQDLHSSFDLNSEFLTEDQTTTQRYLSLNGSYTTDFGAKDGISDIQKHDTSTLRGIGLYEVDQYVDSASLENGDGQRTGFAFVA